MVIQIADQVFGGLGVVRGERGAEQAQQAIAASGGGGDAQHGIGEVVISGGAEAHVGAAHVVAVVAVVVAALGEEGARPQAAQARPGASSPAPQK